MFCKTRNPLLAAESLLEDGGGLRRPRPRPQHAEALDQSLGSGTSSDRPVQGSLLRSLTADVGLY